MERETQWGQLTYMKRERCVKRKGVELGFLREKGGKERRGKDIGADEIGEWVQCKGSRV